MYIAIEGIDGSGKSTLVNNLKSSFKDATFIREPGTTKFAEEIRKVVFSNVNDADPVALQLAMVAARADLKNKLNPNDFIISDRCFMSGSYCKSIKSEEDIRDWLVRTLAFTRIPDLIIYLDITADESVNRVSQRCLFEGYDTLLKNEIEERIQSYNNWIKVAISLNINIIKINANKSIQEVNDEVYELITKQLQGEEQCQGKT